MKIRLILLFIISLNCSLEAFAQEEVVEAAQDSVPKKQYYALRFGIDLSMPIIELFNEEEKGLEIVADFRISNKFYIAGEFGYEDHTRQEDHFNFTTNGEYVKLGVNYNTYENWEGMYNQIYIGARYGTSFFDHTLNSYSPNVYGNYFEPELLTPGTEFKSLNAHWLEFVAGLQVETFKNLYLGAMIEFKTMLYTKEPENFKNLYVPGFNNVSVNNFGFGFNYTITYNIPIAKRD